MPFRHVPQLYRRLFLSGDQRLGACRVAPVDQLGLGQREFLLRSHALVCHGTGVPDHGSAFRVHQAGVLFDKRFHVANRWQRSENYIGIIYGAERLQHEQIHYECERNK